MALSSTFTQNFTSQINGQDISITLDPNHQLSSVRTLGTSFKVDNAVTRGGAGLSFQMSNNVANHGNITFSYSKTNYLTNFTPYVNWGGASGMGVYMYFYNKTWGRSNMDDYIVILYFGKNTGDIGYYENGILDLLIDNVYSTGWVKASFNIESETGVCSYYTNCGAGYHEDGFVNNATLVNLGYRIDRMFFISNSATTDFHIDDLNYTISNSYSSVPSSPGCTDLTPYSQIGHFAYTTYTYNYPYIIKKYFVPVTTTIKAVLLECNLAQISDDGDLFNYNLFINGLDIGHPICDYTNGDEVIFEWSCNVTLTDEYPVFTFYHSQHTSAGQYWKIGTSTFAGGSDLDSDGDTTYYLSASGFTPSSDYPGTYSASSWGDLGMMWFTTGFTTTTTYEYGDSLGLSYWNYLNATGYVYDINSPNGISCSYTLSTISKGYNCRIELWKNGTQTNTFNFPRYITYPSGAESISPTTIGKYHFKLYSYHYLANITAWVTGTLSNYHIFINPKTGNQFSNYVVSCRYYHPQGLNGFVGVFDNVEDVNTFSKALHTYPISLNTTTDISYSSNSSTSEFWQLFSYSTNGYTSVGQYATHYVKLPFIFSNTIEAESPTIKLGNVEMLDVTHTFPGCDIYVSVNGIKFTGVGGSQVSKLVYTPSKAGKYNASLIINQNGTNVLLDYTSFNVTTSTGDKPTDDLTNLITGIIPEEFKLPVGIVIIIIFSLLPIIIIITKAKESKSEIKIPGMVLTILCISFAWIGWTLDIMWGLLPWWSFFALIMILIFVLLILYFIKNKEE